MLSGSQRRLNSARQSEADLSRKCIVLTEADLSYADLSKASLRDASAMRAVFRRSNLTGADFTGADVRRVQFTGSVLEGAQFTNATGVRWNCFKRSLSGSGTQLRRCPLPG
jgi:uncharacterized protein YjbI with pentapeptide repeats